MCVCIHIGEICFTVPILKSCLFLSSQGPPHQLVVKPTEEVCIENGTPAGFKVEVQDEFENITTHSKLIVRCQVNFSLNVYAPQI